MHAGQRRSCRALQLLALRPSVFCAASVAALLPRLPCPVLSTWAQTAASHPDVAHQAGHHRTARRACLTAARASGPDVFLSSAATANEPPFCLLRCLLCSAAARASCSSSFFDLLTAPLGAIFLRTLPPFFPLPCSQTQLYHMACHALYFTCSHSCAAAREAYSVPMTATREELDWRLPGVVDTAANKST